MTRPALSATRAIKVVNFLAGRSGEGFTLSELTRELGVNTGSLHAVLGVLADEGYVVRDDYRKTYRLGSSLVAVGQAALDEQPAVRRAKEEAKALASELGIEAVAVVHVHSELLIVASEGRPDRLPFRPRVAQRLPLVPPIGILSAGLLSEAEREAWLARIGPGATEELKSGYRKAIAVIREAGYEIGLETPTREKIRLAMLDVQADPLSAERADRLMELIGELGREDHHLLHAEPGKLYPVNHMTSAIFGPKGEYVAALTLLGFEELIDAATIERHLNRLLAATQRITRETGGRPPRV